MSAVIILENDNDKVRYILEQNSCFGTDNVFIARSVLAAQLFLSMPGIGKVRLFVDYELDPGCGSGFEFLEWVLKARLEMIIDVMITSYAPSWRKEMLKLCNAAKVTVGALKAPFSIGDGELKTV